MRVDEEFQVLYESEFETVFRAAYLLSGSRQVAEDAVQESFAKALARWGRLRGQRWAGGWVMSTALNEVRRARRRGALAPTPGESEADRDLLLDLWRAIAALPRRQQEAVVLYYIRDLPVDRVARVMGCQDGTVKAHLARARVGLARFMGGEADED